MEEFPYVGFLVIVAPSTYHGIDIVDHLSNRSWSFACCVTPDLDWFAKRVLESDATTEAETAYLDFVTNFLKRDVSSWCDAINTIFYEHGHRYIWSQEELRTAVANAGFTDLATTRAAYPADPIFEKVEEHPRLIGHDLDALEAFAVEARLPSRQSPELARCREALSS